MHFYNAIYFARSTLKGIVINLRTIKDNYFLLVFYYLGVLLLKSITNLKFAFSL